MIDLDQHLYPALQPTRTGLKAILAYLALRRGLGRTGLGGSLFFLNYRLSETGRMELRGYGWGTQKWETRSP